MTHFAPGVLELNEVQGGRGPFPVLDLEFPPARHDRPDFRQASGEAQGLGPFPHRGNVR